MTEGKSCCSKKEGSCESKKGYVCPLTGFHFYLNRTFIRGAMIMIVWTNLFAWIWHGNIMSSYYVETAYLWRQTQDVILSALNCGLTLIAFVCTYIFMKGYEGTGWKEGLRFGILVTLIFFGAGLIQFATQPVPFNLIAMWALGDLISYSIGSILLTKVFTKNTPCCDSKTECSVSE